MLYPTLNIVIPHCLCGLRSSHPRPPLVPLFFGNFTKAGNSAAAAAQGCNFESNKHVQHFWCNRCRLTFQGTAASYGNDESRILLQIISHESRLCFCQPSWTWPTQNLLRQSIARRILKIVRTNHGGWVDSCCACGDHSRSRPVDCLAAELSPLIENLAAVYGRETDLKELLPFPTHCPACQNRLAERRSSAAAAIIVDLAGIVEKQHVPLRCRRPSCPDFGVLYWHNYSVREGRHVFHGKLPGFRYCFMLSSVFGFSVPWLQQFHAGLVRQHASFTSEADVLTAQAACLRLLISQGWFTWRLLTRALGADMELSEMEFLKPLEDMVALFLPQLRHTFGQNMLQMRCDVVVLDGNAKNRRAVCAAALAGSSHSEHLPRTLRHTCTRTPAFRHAFCRWHCEGPMDGEDHLQVQGLGHCHLCCFLLAEKMCPCLRPQLQDVEIVRHKVVNDGQQLMVLLKETMEPQREAWVSGACVPAAVVEICATSRPRKAQASQAVTLGSIAKPWQSIFSIAISFSACWDKQSCRPAAALRLHRSHAGHLFYAQRKHSCPKAA